ncbi:MAG: TlpA family protein disulfide reductase [Candidatus Bathyarchaeia archaeon]
MYDIEKIRRNSEPVSGYLSSIGAEHESFARRLEEYRLDGKVVEALKRHAGRAVVVVFSAEWCPDCARNVPVLGLISEATGLEVRVFGHLKRDPLNPKARWRIPPSPTEIKEFDVSKIPHIAVLDTEGAVIGEIIENPPEGKSLEEALLHVLEGS